MPAADVDLENPPAVYTELPFPSLKRAHILHCSIHYWYPKYRSLTPKARLVPLSDAFVQYLKADGIVLPPDNNDADGQDDEIEFESSAANTTPRPKTEDDISDYDDDDLSEDEDSQSGDPSEDWPEVHTAIQNTIHELGGVVAPKLNWSAPKDATWINPTNSMECRSANDIYLMFKSSDFITHDLEHWDDDCEVEPEHDDDRGQSFDSVATSDDTKLQYTLMLRKYVQINPSVEFRCFVRKGQLIGICQRDLNHFEFLQDMIPALRDLIASFFDSKLKTTFPDENYCFDVYIPAPHKKVWLIDINPWALRTDPLLFSWLELLTMDVPEIIGSVDEGIGEEAFVRLSIRPAGQSAENSAGGAKNEVPLSEIESVLTNSGFDGEEDDGVEDIQDFVPQFRIVRKDDPEAYSFNTPQYSAHKLPKDVVEASQSGPGPLREFADQWKEALAREGR